MYIERLIPSKKLRFRCSLLMHVNTLKVIFLLLPDLSILAVAPAYLTARQASYRISKRIKYLVDKIRHIKTTLRPKFDFGEKLLFAGRMYKVFIEVSTEEKFSFTTKGICIAVEILERNYVKRKVLDWFNLKAYFHSSIKLSEAFYLINIFGTLDWRFINVRVASSGVKTVKYLEEECTLVVNVSVLKLPLKFLEYFICYSLVKSATKKHGKEFLDKFIKLLPSADINRYSV